ncbi:transposase [Acidobacterium sp. S8]|jgi:putative transposase|uniref:REP-associated tyrosine transposase n=1 Tax=Acidobacterium sp. S8 TaxID=1641854 RepID=UPI00131D29AE|nr:transposase [Acidobacterium sp. S8]
MPWGLNRFQETKTDLHFITFSCYQRKPYLNTPQARSLCEESIEKTRQKYGFVIPGYVIMPEHVHLLVSEPPANPLATAIKAIKVSISKQSTQNPFWTPRYYDFNVYSERKRIEKLRYIHRNPVKRGLAAKPEDWPWSSFIHYATGEAGTVEIESHWTARRRERTTAQLLLANETAGAPGSRS